MSYEGMLRESLKDLWMSGSHVLKQYLRRQGVAGPVLVYDAIAQRVLPGVVNLGTVIEDLEELCGERWGRHGG